jgi:hypothetical protein
LVTLWSWVIEVLGDVIDTLFLFGTVPAFAAAPNPMSDSRAQQLLEDAQRMRRTVQNLFEMAEASQGAEERALEGIADSGTATLADVSKFSEVAVIYRRMTCEHDKAEAAKNASIAFVLDS